MEMDINNLELHDHFLLAYILEQVVKQACKCPLIKQNTIEMQKDYPFATYQFVNLEHQTTGDWLGKGRQYKTLVQLDIHDSQPFKALELCQSLHEALQAPGYRRFFKQAGMLPEDISDTSDRTALAGVNYDNDFGFDCSFLVNSGGISFKVSDLSFVLDQDIEIKTVHSDGKADGRDRSIDAFPEYKEVK